MSVFTVETILGWIFLSTFLYHIHLQKFKDGLFFGAVAFVLFMVDIIKKLWRIK